MRIGYGEDAHRLVEGRPLWIGGVAVPSDRGAEAHSDGDALLHALTDAVLSALGLGDIGMHFPNDAAVNRGRASAEFLSHALELARERDLAVRQVSAVVILDRPKLGPAREAILARLSDLLGLSPDMIGLTFKTSEGLAPDHVQARAMVWLD